MQENPAALEPVLQQIGAQSPQLLEAIRANTAEFLAMLNEPITPGLNQPPVGAMPGIPGGMPSPQQVSPLLHMSPS